MTDPSQLGRTVTEIAFLHGFNNASHFGRVFRVRFGATPSEYRRRSAAS
jgi:AraC-like DNA-binding protein